MYGVIGYIDEKLLDSCCGLRYIRDLRCGICYAFIERMRLRGHSLRVYKGYIEYAFMDILCV